MGARGLMKPRESVWRSPVSLAGLRWLTVIVPVVFLAVLDVLRHVTPFEILHTWPASLLTLGLLVGGVAVFSKAVLDQVEAMQDKTVRQNKELAALEEGARHQAEQLRGLHEAGLALAADLSLEAVLQRVVDLARDLAHAQYGALSVLDEGRRIERFITSGITAEERAGVGPPPSGRGLLGLVLEASEPLRTANIADHPSSAGFPPGHPPMSSFLGMPLTYKGRVLGNLYLTNKQGAAEFSEGDAAVLRLFAAQAAVAIENARLHAQVQRMAIEEERQRIAREMHDGMAQVLGYVNVKAGAARRLVDLGRVEEAALELQQLENAAREVYAEVREAILGLRTIVEGGPGLVGVLQGYLERFSEQSGIQAELEADAGDGRVLLLQPEEEVQLIRVVQEALSNVRKHARANRACVRIAIQGNETVLEIEDDGRGFEPGRAHRAAPQFGLQTMRERAEGLGGFFSVESQPGKGTRVTVRIPRKRDQDT